MMMIPSRGILANKKTTSKDVINKPASCSQIISAKSKESFEVNSLEVRYRNKGTKNFTHLYKIGQNLGKPSISGLCILDEPYMIPGCEPCR